MKLTQEMAPENSKDSDTGHRKIPVIWILVVDQHIVRLFKKNDHGIEIFGEIMPTFHEKKAITNKSVGRSVSSSGGGTIHHKYEPHIIKSRKESRSFTHEVADWLDKSVKKNAFDRLVLVAPPQTLGELRKVLSGPVHARIVAEVDKNLTKMSEKGLQEELAKIVWF